RDLGATAGLAEREHPLRVAAERRDVVAHPREREHEVELAHVAGVREPGSAEALQVQVAERIQAMVDGDDDDVLRGRQPPPVVQRAGAGAVRVGAAVDVEHDRAPTVVQPRRPDVQEQAILADALAGAVLRRRGTVLEGIGGNVPARGRKRRHEPARARVGAVTNAAKHGDAGIHETAHVAVCRAHDRVRGAGEHGAGREQAARRGETGREGLAAGEGVWSVGVHVLLSRAGWSGAMHAPAGEERGVRWLRAAWVPAGANRSVRCSPARIASGLTSPAYATSRVTGTLAVKRASTSRPARHVMSAARPPRRRTPRTCPSGHAHGKAGSRSTRCGRPRTSISRMPAAPPKLPSIWNGGWASNRFW